MSNRFTLPLETPVDATGAPYPGGKLFFYQSGTSTKLDTFSNSGLTIANTNPVVLDSAGRFPNAIFLQNAPYSVVLSPSTDTDPPTSPIWTQDPVYTSDYSAAAQFTSGSGNPNGVVAGTAGSATIKASVYWDYVNFILYVCTITGTASTALWTAVNAASAQNAIPAPQGRLTLTSGTPVLTGDVTAATSVFYTAYTGNTVPIYNGSSFALTTFAADLTLTLTSSQAANTLYDVFVFNNSGTPTLVTGPAWSTSTPGSGSRGTGASTTQLSRLNGLWVNTVLMTGRNGATSYSINASFATYLGTIHIDATAGQVSCYTSWGQNRKWGVWNAFNRRQTTVLVGDSTASWAYGTNTARASNNVPSSYSANAFNAGSGTACNGAVILQGLAEEMVNADFRQVTTGNAVTNIAGRIGCGFNSITAFSGMTAETTGGSSPGSTGPSQFISPPSLGINNYACVEAGINSTTFIGTSAFMQMSLSYMS